MPSSGQGIREILEGKEGQVSGGTGQDGNHFMDITEECHHRSQTAVGPRVNGREP